MSLIVSFVSQKGGVGKSTLARALGAVAAADLKVRIADLDIQQQTSVRWSKARNQTPSVTHFDVAPFHTIGEAIEEGRAFDIILVDTPGHTSASTRSVALASHVVVVPTGVTMDDLYPTLLLLRALEEIGISRARFAIALCRVLETREEMEARTYIETAGYDVLNGCIPERAAYRYAQNRGLALTEALDLDSPEPLNHLIVGLLTKIAAQSTKA